MSLENHVPTLETCITLKEAGFEQNTELYWHSDNESKPLIRNNRFASILSEDYFAAPLATELMKSLPAGLAINDKYFLLTITQSYLECQCYYYCKESDIKEYLIQEGYMTENLAQMWIELKKEGVVN